MTGFYKEQRFLENIQPWLESIRQGRIYAFAASGRMGLPTFMPPGDQPRFAGVFDNNKALWGETRFEAPVLPPATAASADGKILVFTADYHRAGQQLTALGLSEFVDFMYYSDFLTLYHWHCRNKVFLNSVHIAVTTRCTLRCDNCNMFIPRYENPEHIPLETLIDDFEKLTATADYIQFLGLLGGEPLLHPDLEKYLLHLAGRRDCLGAIEITTNGTVPPSLKLLEICRKAGIALRISDYSASAPADYPARRQRLLELLRAESVLHSNAPAAAWNQFFVPGGGLLRELDEEGLARHFRRCSPMFKGLGSGRFYHCHLSWSAARCGLAEDAPADSLELNGQNSRRELVRRTLGRCPSGCPALCRQCYGCDPQYQFPAAAGPSKGGRA